MYLACISRHGVCIASICKVPFHSLTSIGVMVERFVYNNCTWLVSLDPKECGYAIASVICKFTFNSSLQLHNALKWVSMSCLN